MTSLRALPNEPAVEPRGGIRSVEVAGRILLALAEAGGSAALGELARRAVMPPSKVHRYLVSLARVGLVTQDEVQGRYAIGAFGLRLGLVALGRIDPVRLGMPIVEELRDQLRKTVGLAIWTDAGAAVVGWAPAAEPVTVNARLGSILPLLTSATGRVFLAFLPAEQTVAMVEAELAALATAERAGWTAARLDALRREARVAGFTEVRGDLVPGVAAMAVPVLDHGGRIVAALTTVGPQSGFEGPERHRAAQALRHAGQRLSALLGHAAAA